MKTGLGFVRFNEAASLLGLAENTVRRYTSQKKIPHLKVGRLVFFDPERLRDWIESKKVEPVERSARR